MGLSQFLRRPFFGEGDEHKDDGRGKAEHQRRDEARASEDDNKGDESQDLDLRQMAGDGTAEQERADEIEGRTTNDGAGRSEISMAVRMGQREFIADGAHDDAGDDEEMDVSVSEARQLARIAGCADGERASL